MKYLVSFVVGLLFSIGLGVSGMTQPQKVVGFLDLFGEWNPALAMVMVGAILVHGISYQWIKHRSSPILGGKFQIPTSQDIDGKLILGAMIFGTGWGLGGFCPGPALTSLGSFQTESIVFVVAMMIGMGTFRVLQPFLK